jgi:hypothetical protein
LWDTIWAWLAVQPAMVQVMAGVAALAVAYFLWVVLRVIMAALYAVFFR